MSVIVSTLGEVELGVELGWNYMKFHLNSTPNSTSCKPLIIRAVTPMRWKGGITNDKKYFSGNSVEKVLTTVKLVPFAGCLCPSNIYDLSNKENEVLFFAIDPVHHFQHLVIIAGNAYKKRKY